jgi:SAM-dependent methyltransferase
LTPERCSRNPALGLQASTSAYDAELIALLADVEDQSFWFRCRNELIVSVLRRRFPDAASFLEIGCGTGFVLRGIREALPGLTLTGAELSTAGLEVARRRLPGVRLLELDVLEMPFEDAFDVVGAFDVLEHIDDDEAALRGILRAIQRSGGAIVTVPQHPRMWSAFDEVSRHYRRYTRSELVAKLERAGFAHIWTTSFVTLPLPAMVVSRLRHPAGSRDFDLEASLRLPRSLDRICERAMRIERRAIEAGLCFPVGGSLLAVARKP